MIRSILLTILFLWFLATEAQYFNKGDYNLYDEVKKTFESNHVDHHVLKDSIERRLPDQFISLIEKNGQLFTLNEKASLSKDISHIVESNPTSFITYLNGVFTLLQDCFLRRKSFLEGIATLNFNDNDSIYVDFHNKKVKSPESLKELEELWIKTLKFETLLQFERDSSQRENASFYLNQKLRQLLESEVCKIESLIGDEELKRFLLSNFIKAYAQSFDPHSDFLSIQEIERFASALSSEVYSVGLVFIEQSNRYVVIEKIPFSSAAKETDINLGDEILAIWTGDRYEVLSCLTQETVEELFYGYSIREVKVQLKSSKDQKVREFLLQKKIISNSENHTFSYVLQRENNRIGYIQFPGFYSNMDGISRSSSKDMALILLKLRDKNLNGLIVDLRGNGGGSVSEARDLASYFVDYGPLYLEVNTVQKSPKLIKEGKPGKLVSTRTLFLVDGLSASASELLVSMLKNYDDILIVGANTYGKATGFMTIPVIPPYERRTLGYALVTYSKMFNLSGESYQNAGITPDVEIPTVFSSDIVGERVKRFALDKKRVNKKVRPLEIRDIPIDSLNALSKNRQQLNSSFKAIEKMNSELENLLKHGFSTSLNHTNFRNPFSLIVQTIPPVDTAYFSVTSMEENEVFLKESKEFKVKMIEDPVISEAFLIFEDWLTIDSKDE